MFLLIYLIQLSSFGKIGKVERDVPLSEIIKKAKYMDALLIFLNFKLCNLIIMQVN